MPDPEKIPIRLGGYAERRKPLASESKRGKMLVLLGIGVVHAVLIGLWWMARGADRPDVIEYVRYFDIAVPATGAAVTPGPEVFSIPAESVAAAASARAESRPTPQAQPPR